MRILFGLIIAACLGIGTPMAQELKAYSTAKVFKGPEGERITMVFLEPRAKDQLLIKFQGVEGEWDDRVLRHQRVTLGRDRENYELLNVKGDPNYVSVVYRGGAYEVYPKGSKRMPVRMAYSEAESKLVEIGKIVAEYAKAQR